MNVLGQLRLTLSPALNGLVFLICLVILAPLGIEALIWNSDKSLSTTEDIFKAYLLFFLGLVPLVIPVVRKIFNWFRMKEFSLFVDSAATVLLILASALPLVMLSAITIPLLKQERLGNYRYRILNFSASAGLFFSGIWLEFKAARERNVRLLAGNHTAGIPDYLCMIKALSIDPYNIVAGINLSKDRKGLFNRFLASSIGSIVRDHSISVDRTDPDSGKEAYRRMQEELQAGKNIGIFPEGGRTPWRLLKKGVLLRPFKDGVFRLAWDNQEPIQPVIFDFPATWKGKDDPFWGIHPSRITVRYLPSLHPKNYQSMESFKQAVWHAMHEELKASVNVYRFLQTT